jgi:F-type H+-transporting ATPase subunit a
MKKRYIIYLCVILLFVFGSVIRFTQPVLPVIQLPGEILVDFEGTPLAFLGGLTNTFVATILTFVLLILLALTLRAGSRTADEIPTGFYNFFEMVVEGIYGYVQNAAGKWAPTFFPWFLTFILWIVTANWMELIPGVDAIGKWENLPHHEAVLEARAAEAEGEPMSEEEIHALEEEIDHENVGNLREGIFLIKAPTNAEGEKPEEADWTIIPYVRAAATDLNFTVALALISVVMTWYYGMRALGIKYWGQFFVWNGDKIARNPLAILDPVVGLLELIGQLARILSFSFRLLGNIFAGQVLLFVIASLIPLANLLFWHLEFAVGILQAVIFGLLTLTFMAGAVAGHHGEEEHH